MHLCTHSTFQSLENINRELEVLSAAPATPPPVPETLERDYRERSGISRSKGYLDRLDGPLLDHSFKRNTGPILDSGGKPLRPFTLLDSRQKLLEGVFKPGHNLPTMTIDEYLKEEKRRGGLIEGGGEASGIAPELDEDDYEKSDLETMKARNWDDFVEANPK
jgi:immunoglobulin-binding protein 1